MRLTAASNGGTVPLSLVALQEELHSDGDEASFP